MRLKESEFTNKIAVYEQRIQLLESHLKETEEREANQKIMYDRMFKAIEESNGYPSKRNDELLNSSQHSLSKEVEDMHKQF